MAGPGPPPEASFPRWRVFPVLALGTVMATLDISIVNIALPTLSRPFRVPLTFIEWVVIAYVLAITALLLVAGEDLERALRALPEAFREAGVLRDVQGLSYAEIAAARAIPVGTVMSRIHQGRALLREALGGRTS